MQNGHAKFPEAFCFESPGIFSIAKQGFRQECPDALAVAGAGGVFGSRYVYMMAAQMFDLESVISDRGEQDAAKRLFQAGATSVGP